MLCIEVIGVNCEISAEHINTYCRQNASYFNVNADSKYFGFKGLIIVDTIEYCFFLFFCLRIVRSLRFGFFVLIRGVR